MTQRRLSSSDRDLFRKVAQAAFANPFSDTRAAVDREIHGDAAAAGPEVIRGVVEIISQRLREIDRPQPAKISDFAGDDARLFETVIHFQLFHRFAEHFDQLIQSQLRQQSSAKAPFAQDALQALAERGLTPARALTDFSFFYQLRRAFYFIGGGLKGGSRCMREFRGRIWENVFTYDPQFYGKHLWNRMEDFSTLLLGETGTGKGNAAAAIGRSGFIPFDEKSMKFSENFVQIFISLNLSQFPESLIESELFGHRKGSFTGAVENYQGAFSRCNSHGAIFLDEVGDISVPVQVKLLRVLQERVFSPVGGHDQEQFSGRIIAATNKPIDHLRQNQQFRDDFYYRLCSDVVHIPPLRVRLAEDPNEMPILVADILERTTKASDQNVTDHVVKRIRGCVPDNYSWPGNVRELEQCTRRILLTDRYQVPARDAAIDDIDGALDLLVAKVEDFEALLGLVCKRIYSQVGSMEEVGRRLNLDRRTVKKYLSTAS